jgi:hypothetical protein
MQAAPREAYALCVARLWNLVAVLATCACGNKPAASGSPTTTPSAPTPSATTGVTTGGGSVAADDEKSEPSDGGVQGFVAAAAGELAGRVVDADGRPVANQAVHLVTKAGKRTVTTDQQGKFTTQITEPTMVVVYGGAQVSGSTVATEQIDGAEAIDVRAIDPPTKLAKALSDPTLIPDYTAALRDKNAWLRAWVLLDVNDKGAVSRVKLLDPPGHGLDGIVVRDAFKLKFEPARNRIDKPISSLVVWRFEWPPPIWNHGRKHIPRDAGELPCRRKASDTWFQLNTPYRDCSPPNMTAAITAQWIGRPKK